MLVFCAIFYVSTRWRNKIKSTNIDKKLHMSLIFSNYKSIKFKSSHVQPIYKIRENSWDMQAILTKSRQ